jgi:hypothetical protein
MATASDISQLLSSLAVDAILLTRHAAHGCSDTHTSTTMPQGARAPGLSKQTQMKAPTHITCPCLHSAKHTEAPHHQTGMVPSVHRQQGWHPSTNLTTLLMHPMGVPTTSTSRACPCSQKHTIGIVPDLQLLNFARNNDGLPATHEAYYGMLTQRYLAWVGFCARWVRCCGLRATATMTPHTVGTQRQHLSSQELTIHFQPPCMLAPEHARYCNSMSHSLWLTSTRPYARASPASSRNQHRSHTTQHILYLQACRGHSVPRQQVGVLSAAQAALHHTSNMSLLTCRRHVTPAQFADATHTCKLYSTTQYIKDPWHTSVTGANCSMSPQCRDACTALPQEHATLQVMVRQMRAASLCSSQQ